MVTGAPLASRTADVAGEARAAGWSVAVVATRAALAWIDTEAVRRQTGSEVNVDYRKPGEPKRGPEPAAVVLCPGTFNSINKVAQGLADNYALGLLCEAVGRAVPVVVFPVINEHLWRHPERSASFEILTGAGVAFRDPVTGAPGAQAVASDTDDLVVTAFDPGWVVTALR